MGRRGLNDHVGLGRRGRSRSRGGRWRRRDGGLHDDLLLRGALELPRRLGAGAQALNGGEHVLLLSQEGVAELLKPVELLVQHREHLGEEDQRLHAVVPGLLLQRFVELSALETGIFLHKARGLNDLEWIGGGHQDLRHQGVGVERDRRHELIDFLGLECFRRILRYCRKGQEHDDQHDPDEDFSQRSHTRLPRRYSTRCVGTRQSDFSLICSVSDGGTDPCYDCL